MPYRANFCAPRLLWQALLLGQLLVLVLVLSPLNKQLYQWQNLALVSLFVQWLVLSSLALLCALQGWLVKQPWWLAQSLIYGLILLNTAFISELAWRFFAVSLLAQLPNPIHQHQVFLLRILGISALLSAVFLHYWSVYQQAKRLAQAEAQARLQALQARINPHFLFNSMNTIAALIADKPRLAEQAVEDLADLFRATLQTGQKRVTLAQELALCRQYLRIESLRLQQRLRVEWWVDLLPTDALVPILSLQPLLENAIRHGVQTHVAGGVIRIVGIADEHGIKIDVENALPKPQQLPSDGVHMALDNIRQRLQWYYGARGRLEVKQDGEKYQVSLCFPIEYSA